MTTYKKLTAKQVSSVLADLKAHMDAEQEHQEKLKTRKGE